MTICRLLRRYIAGGGGFGCNPGELYEMSAKEADDRSWTICIIYYLGSSVNEVLIYMTVVLN
jgi:hypothetical protein